LQNFENHKIGGAGEKKKKATTGFISGSFLITGGSSNPNPAKEPSHATPLHLTRTGGGVFDYNDLLAP